MTPDLPGFGSPLSADDATAGVTRHPEAGATRFESILFGQPEAGPAPAGQRSRTTLPT